MCVCLVEPIVYHTAMHIEIGEAAKEFCFFFVFPDQRPIHLFNWLALLFSETLFDHQTLLGVARN